jgi:hypothetical protein
VTAERVTARFRAALKLIYPDDITPMGRRMLEKVLDEEEAMRTETLDVAYTIGDLAGLPVGTRIATNHNKILFRDEAWGKQHWIEEGTLSPFFDALVHWLPAFILPPVVDHSLDA